MLLFITYHSKTSLTTAAVSIHLMLLFIHTSFNFMQHLLQFQYISCYSLSQYDTSSRIFFVRFNTSHVTLYQEGIKFLGFTHRRFNTSHVTLYQSGRICDKLQLWFQYISCYSLSEHHGEIPKGKMGFNTSHVTLYRQFDEIGLYIDEFQYISCYSLSGAKEAPAHGRSGFQYISCYSLSLYFTAFLTPNIFIIPQNTMHCKIFTRRLDNSLFWD